MKSNDRITVIILGLLAQEAMNGYALKKRMELSVSNFVRPSFGNIYPTLKKLDEAGEIRNISPTSDRKSVYQTTPKGIQTLKNWLISPLNANEPFLLREYFFGFISQAERHELVRAYIASLKTLNRHYLEIEANYGTVMGEFPYATLRFGMSQVTHDIAWYENRLKEL